jgi:hypothetical protein
VLLNRPPVYYRTVAVLEFVPPPPSLDSENSLICSKPSSSSLAIITSERIAAQVVSSFTESERRELLRADQGRVVMPLMRDIVNVTVSDEALFQIRILCIHQNPRAAILVANRYAKVFLEYLWSSNKYEMGKAIEDLRMRLHQLEDKIRLLESTYESVKQSNDAARMDVTSKRPAGVPRVRS